MAKLLLLILVRRTCKFFKPIFKENLLHVILLFYQRSQFMVPIVQIIMI